MAVVAGADWVIDLGPSGGDKGGQIMAAGTPAAVAQSKVSRTAPYLAAALGQPTTS
jgi:excinuclease ABC subunit A